MSIMRVLIADASATFRKMFSRAVSELDETATVVSVNTIDEVLDQAKRNDFRIVVVDAELIEQCLILSELASYLPKAFILMTTRPTSVSDAKCNEARAHGATDCLTKPIQRSYNDNYRVVKQKMSTIMKNRSNDKTDSVSDIECDNDDLETQYDKHIFKPDLLLIASSTGGPTALQSILMKLDADFPMPILIVQHMLPKFTDTLASNLDSKSHLTVKVAENMETAESGVAYIAPGGKHLKINSERNIILSNSPPISGLRPAADVLFASVAELYMGTGVLVVILTGMGYDGVKGLSQLKACQECYCIAQSEKTCVVYGMPRAAVESGYADAVIDLDKIANEINRLVGQDNYDKE